jgi:K+-sensing histidine kinase KdpD
MSAALWTDTSEVGRRAIDPLVEIAHDLRQPLATIRALIESLNVAEFSPDVVRWHLDNMKEQVDQLGDYVQAFLAGMVADPGADAVEDIRCVGANGSVAAAVQSFAVTWPGHITTSFGEEALVPAPPELLRRSVRNVLDNAARAAGKNGAILVTVINSLMGTSIAIEDNGPGFGAIAAQHSIGLKVVDRTLSAVGGALEITTSEALGGARVAMTFPSQPTGTRFAAHEAAALR